MTPCTHYKQAQQPGSTYRDWLALAAELAGRRAVAQKALANGSRQRPAVLVGLSWQPRLQPLLQLAQCGGQRCVEAWHSGQQVCRANRRKA